MIPQLPKLTYAGEVSFSESDLTLVEGDATTLSQIEAGDEFIIDYDPPLIFQAATDAEDLTAGSTVSSFTLEIPWPGATGSDSGYVVTTSELSDDERACIRAVNAIDTFANLSTYEGEDIGYLVLSLDGDGSPAVPIIYRLANVLVEGAAASGDTQFISYETGEAFGDMDSSPPGIEAAFSGSGNKAAADCATTNGDSAYIGQHKTSKIAKAFVCGSNDTGYIDDGDSPGDSPPINITIELYGAQDDSPEPSNATDGTFLGSITFENQADESAPREITSSDTTTEFEYFWVRITSDKGSPADTDFYVSRVEFHKPTTVPTLVPDIGWVEAFPDVTLPAVTYAGEVSVTNGDDYVVGDATTLSTVLSTHTLFVNRDGVTQIADVLTDAVSEPAQPLTGIYFTVENGWPTDEDSPSQDSPFVAAPDLPSGTVRAYKIDESNGGNPSPLFDVSRIGEFTDRATFDAQAEGFSFVSVDGIGGEEEAKRWDRVGASGTWKAIELVNIPADDNFENPILNPQGYVKDPYIEDAAKSDLDPFAQTPWYALAQAGTVTASEADTDLTISRGLKLTKTGSAGRMGAAQIILKSDMPHLFGQDLVLIGKVRMTTGDGSPIQTAVRLAIGSDTGTDNAPLDPVDDWTDPTFSEGNFFIPTDSPVDFVVNGVDAINTIDGEMMPFALAVDPISLDQGRLILMVWTEDSVATTETLEFSEFDLRVVDFKPFKPQPVETVANTVNQSTPDLLTFTAAPGYTTSHSNTELDPFPGVGAQVTLTVEADQWFERNSILNVTNKGDQDRAFRMRVTEYSGTSLTGIVNKSNGTDVNDDWVISLAPGIPSGSSVPPTSLTFIGKAISTNSASLTATLDSGSIQRGDILVWGDRTTFSSGVVVPSGFEIISSLSSGSITQVLAARLAVDADDGAVMVGMTPLTGSAGKTLLCFRPDVAASIMEIAGVNDEISDGAPSNQIIEASAVGAPVLKIACYGSSGDVDPRGWDTTKDDEVENDYGLSEFWLAWEIDNSSPADTTVSMQDEGFQNSLQSCYITVAAVDFEPGDTVIFEDDGSGNARYPDAVNSSPNVDTLESGNLSSTSVSFVEDTPGLWATYRELHLFIDGLSSDTASRNWIIRHSTDSGSTFKSSNYAGVCLVPSAGAFNAFSNGLLALATATMGVAGTSTDISCLIQGHQGGTTVKARYEAVLSSGATYSGVGSYVADTSAVNGLQIVHAGGSGNFDAGTYTLVGVR